MFVLELTQKTLSYEKFTEFMKITFGNNENQQVMLGVYKKLLVFLWYML